MKNSAYFIMLNIMRVVLKKINNSPNNKYDIGDLYI